MATKRTSRANSSRRRTRGDINDLLLQLVCKRLPTPEREVRFAWAAMRRAWRLDLAWRAFMLAVEVDGATWTQGRHTRGAGYEADCEKLNAAVLLGWRVLRFTYGQVYSGYALATIETALAHTTERQP